MSDRLNEEELRADGRIVVDYPKRKAMVYANFSGYVLVMTEQDGDRAFCEFEPQEIPALIAALQRAQAEAQVVSDTLKAEYQTHVAIEDAKGGRA